MPGRLIGFGVPLRAEACCRIAVDCNHLAIGRKLDRISADTTTKIQHASAAVESPSLVASDCFRSALFEANAIKPHLRRSREFARRAAPQIDQSQRSSNQVGRELGAQSVL